MEIFQNKRFTFSLILLLLLPIVIFSGYQIQRYFSKASGFTFKVTRNHQKTCEEQVDWGNHAFIKVIDENNNPLSGTQIEYWPDYPYPNGGIAAPEGILTTDAGGNADFDNRWPGCIGCPAPYSGNHMVNYFFKIKNQASDTAVEISSGIYGNECAGAGYGDFCPNHELRNTWGHWGYEIIFQKKSGDLAITEVSTDHSGQAIVPADKRSQCTYFDFYRPNEDYNPRRQTGATNTPIPGTPTATPPISGSPTPCPARFDYIATNSGQIKNYCDQNNQNCQQLNKSYPLSINCRGRVGPTPSVPVWEPYGPNCTLPGCDCTCVDPNATVTPTLTPTLPAGGSPTATVTPGNPTSTLTPTQGITITPTGTNVTPSPTLAMIDAKLNLKIKFQGITVKPKDDFNKINVKIKLVQNNQTEQTDYQSAVFIADDNGIWSGSLIFKKINKGSDYKIYIKGPKHIQKKICDTNPAETTSSIYNCSTGKIEIKNSEYAFDFSNITLFAGDLPEQDGIIDSYDSSLIRNYLGKFDSASIKVADLNLDNIVDTQDYSLLITTLSTVKNNEDEK